MSSGGLYEAVRLWPKGGSQTCVVVIIFAYEHSHLQVRLHAPHTWHLHASILRQRTSVHMHASILERILQMYVYASADMRECAVLSTGIRRMSIFETRASPSSSTRPVPTRIHAHPNRGRARAQSSDQRGEICHARPQALQTPAAGCRPA